MRRIRARNLSAVAVLATVVACATTPTGRRQLQFFPDDQVAQMGEMAFRQIKQKTPRAADPGVTRYVTCVVRSLTAVVPRPKGGGRWDVTVFKGDEVNAFALPGGNVGIYTGLLRAARTPAQLAAVIGHEIGHVQAEHGNARLSTQYATETGLNLVQALGRGSAVESQQVMSLLGLGAQVGILLPFSRAQESEADVLGLQYMARAGYDPRAAIELWRNMEAVSGNGPPAFLSTHPSSGQRIDDLQANMRVPMSAYRRAKGQGRQPECVAP